MKKFQTEPEINTQLRKLTQDLRSLRKDFHRGSLAGRRSLLRALDEFGQAADQPTKGRSHKRTEE